MAACTGTAIPPEQGIFTSVSKESDCIAMTICGLRGFSGLNISGIVAEMEGVFTGPSGPLVPPFSSETLKAHSTRVSMISHWSSQSGYTLWPYKLFRPMGPNGPTGPGGPAGLHGPIVPLIPWGSWNPCVPGGLGGSWGLEVPFSP